MGVDAYIEVSRVDEGEFLISDDPSAPQFVVRAPCCVLPVIGRILRATGVRDGECRVLRLDGLNWTDDSQLVVLGKDAIFVAARDSYAFDDGVPGSSMTLGEADAVWAKIVPGRWVVTNYYVSGMGDEAPSYYYRPSAGVRLGASVKWRIWT